MSPEPKKKDWKAVERQFKSALRREERGELTEQELKDLNDVAERRGQSVHDLLWCMWNMAWNAVEQEKREAALIKAQKESGRSKKEPHEQAPKSGVGSMDDIAKMKKAAEECGLTVHEYLLSSLLHKIERQEQQPGHAPGRGKMPAVPPKKHMAVTLNDAAQICGRSTSAIKKWERGENTPEGWPGRGDSVALKAFANTRESRKKTKDAIKNAARFGDMDKISRHVAR
jgi:hypothetical protein